MEQFLREVRLHSQQHLPRAKPGHCADAKLEVAQPVLTRVWQKPHTNRGTGRIRNQMAHSIHLESGPMEIPANWLEPVERLPLEDWRDLAENRWNPVFQAKHELLARFARV